MSARPRAATAKNVLDYNDIKPKKYIVVNDEPYEVLSSLIFRKQKRKPVNQTKLRHLVTGKVTDRSFHQSDKIEEADIAKRSIKYLYNHRGEWWFCDPKDPRKRFELEGHLVKDKARFLRTNENVEALVFEDNIIDIKLPIKMRFAVTEAPPGVRGNTAQGGVKQVKLDNGAIINTPLFVNEGDVVEVNTETGEYSQRVI